MYLEMACTAYNTVFTHRAGIRRPSVHPKHFEEVDAGGQPCEPYRVTAAPLGLKGLGFVNTTTLDEIPEECFLDQKKF
jgi:hypothetical protein